MRTTCTKRYNDIPFAHRQPNHKGHCRFVHGHNWGFEFEFSAEEKDGCGFVVDFGGLKALKEDLGSLLDHKLVLNADDPLFGQLDAAQALTGDRAVAVADCSCEGLAEMALDRADRLVSVITKGRVRVVRCTCFEDSKNSATAYGNYAG